MHGSPSLKLRHLPPFAAINSFSHWPDGLKLETTDNEWHVLLYDVLHPIEQTLGMSNAI